MLEALQDGQQVLAIFDELFDLRVVVLELQRRDVLVNVEAVAEAHQDVIRIQNCHVLELFGNVALGPDEDLEFR